MYIGQIHLKKTFVCSILMKIEPGGDMGGRTPTPSSSSSSLQSTVGLDRANGREKFPVIQKRQTFWKRNPVKQQ